jgi:glycosyltransferase involved in cell wall biosynthesis
MFSSHLISIGMPLFNSDKLVRRSLNAIVNQTYKNIEIIISDNGSNDNTLAICEEFSKLDPRIKIYAHKINKGPGWNFDFVLSESRGDYFLWAAYDDIYDVRFIEECYKKLSQNNAAIGCCSEITFINSDNVINSSWTNSYINIDTENLSKVDKLLTVFQRVGWYATYSLWRTLPLKTTRATDKIFGGDVLHTLKMITLGDILKVKDRLFSIGTEGEKTVDHYQNFNNVENLIQIEGETVDKNSTLISSGQIKNCPYTKLVLDLVQYIFKSPKYLWIEKREFILKVINELTHKNFDWRKRIVDEQLNFGTVISSEQEFKIFLASYLTNGLQTSIQQDNFGNLSIPARPRICIFFPHNPWPPKTGAHTRFLIMIQKLTELGWNIIFISSTFYSDQKWKVESIKLLENQFNITVAVLDLDSSDITFVQAFSLQNKAINNEYYSPPGFRKKFKEITLKVNPQIILINYSFWAGLIEDQSFANIHKIIDTHDILSINNFIRASLHQNIRLNHKESENLWERIKSLNLENTELKNLSLFDRIIAISEWDKLIFEKFLKKKKIEMIPLIPTSWQKIPVDITKNKVIFIGSDNPSNLNGLNYFIEEVLPLILVENKNFILEVYGSISNHFSSINGIHLNGWIENIEDVYKNALFSICPLLLGTGQQAKVSEALSFGVPVVLNKNMADSNLVINGVNGLIFNGSFDFKNICLKLLNNPELALELGENAFNGIKVLSKNLDKTYISMFEA